MVPKSYIEILAEFLQASDLLDAHTFDTFWFIVFENLVFNFLQHQKRQMRVGWNGKRVVT